LVDLSAVKLRALPADFVRRDAFSVGDPAWAIERPKLQRLFDTEGFPDVPWTEFHYPRSMEHLPPLVRAKAIEIANALLEEGYEEGRAIRIAIAKATEWAERRGLS
jgi:hypothetical protein